MQQKDSNMNNAMTVLYFSETRPYLADDLEAHGWTVLRATSMMETLASGLQGVPGELALHGIASVEEVPTVTLAVQRSSRLSALDLVIALQNGSPAIQVDPLLCEGGTVTFNPTCLQPGEAEIIAAAVRRLLS